MAFQGSQFARASIGLLNASGYTTNFNVVNEQAALDVTTLGNTAKAFIVGQVGANGSFDMILDTLPATNSQFDVLNVWKSTTPTPVDFAPEGYATGNPVLMINAIETQATTSAAVNGVALAKVTCLATGNPDLGASVEDYTVITVTANGTARDSGVVGGNSNGGVAHLHVSAFTGVTNDIVTIEHSVDGSTSWATLVTFTTVTGLTSQRVEVAVGTNIRRYLRVVDTITGTPTLTRQVSLARR